MKPLIKKLVEAYGPSGYEDHMRDLIRAEIRGVPDYISVDPLGNLIAGIRSQSKSGKRIMLSAHMDEIGIMVTYVDEKGFCRFTNIGGVRPLNCVGNRVRFANGTTGVIGVEKLSEVSQAPTFDQLYLDVGATSRADCPVKIGDAAGFVRAFEDHGDRLIAKSMDDRIGCVILIETLKALRRTPHEIAFVFSVQEEVGLRGAGVSAYGVEPELGIAVDVTMTGDTPKGPKMEVALGKGPAIKVRDQGMLADPRIKNLLMRRAQDAKLPYQLEVLERGTTDAASMQLARGGVPAGCISIPCRYIHTPSETVDFRDVQAAIKLLTTLLERQIELS
jgi:putative aminopeptidase FrvX